MNTSIMQAEVFGASGIVVTTKFIDPRYSLQCSPDATTEKALLRPFSLIPTVPGLPPFHGRWSERWYRPSLVKVDLDGPKWQRRAFKWGSPGYRGHHTDPVHGRPRVYAIDIHMPDTHVFEGEITLGISCGVAVAMLDVNAGITMEASVVEPNFLRRFCDGSLDASRPGGPAHRLYFNRCGEAAAMESISKILARVCRLVRHVSLDPFLV